MRLAVLFVLSMPLVASSQDFGPIRTRNGRALSLPYLRVIPRTSLLAPGQKALETDFQVANDFRLLTSGSKTVREDQETFRADFTYRLGLRRGELLVGVPFLSRGGGFLDPVIDWWHQNVLHWSDQGRNDTPFGRAVVKVPGRSFGTASGLGDVSILYSQPVGQSVIGTAAVKLPTGDAHTLLGSGGFDAGVSFIASHDLGRRWTGAAQLGLIAQGRGSALPRTRPLVHQEGLFLTWRQSARDAWTVQWQGEASASITGVPGSDATHRLVTFGYERAVNDRRRVQLYFSEDRDLFSGHFPEGANIGPDFTIGVNVSTRF